MIDQSCRAAIGAGHDQQLYRQVLGRAFVHGTMKETCRSFRGGVLPREIARRLPTGFFVPPEIRAIARVFFDIQDQRHLADYDFTERFSRSDVLGRVRDVEAAIRSFKSLAATTEKRFFLACLWAWKDLPKRS